MNETPEQLALRLLADPVARARLVTALAREIGPATAARSPWARLRPFMAGFSSALVVMLAFLLPSIQEQWDQWRSRAAVNRYAEIGRTLLAKGSYVAAEQSFARALELAGNQRLDLLEDQMRARTLRVYDDPDWRGPVSGEVNESDFAYLLELEKSPERRGERAATLAAYGAWLAGEGRLADAEAALKESLALDPKPAAAHVHLGNVYDDLSRPADAEREYRAALARDPDEPSAHYDLGVLLSESGRAAAAVTELRRYVQLEPGESQGLRQLATALDATGAADEARGIRARAARFDARPASRRTACPPDAS
ncbi:MAG: tetratricopeptide repeat protein [Steroidobacteraceae bacterium]